MSNVWFYKFSRFKLENWLKISFSSHKCAINIHWKHTFFYSRYHKNHFLIYSLWQAFYLNNFQGFEFVSPKMIFEHHQSKILKKCKSVVRKLSGHFSNSRRRDSSWHTFYLISTVLKALPCFPRLWFQRNSKNWKKAKNDVYKLLEYLFLTWR